MPLYHLKKGRKKIELELNFVEDYYYGPFGFDLKDSSGDWSSQYMSKARIKKSQAKFAKVLKAFLTDGYEIISIIPDKKEVPLTKEERIKKEVDDLINGWNKDLHDNYKDVIQDLRSLLSNQIISQLPKYKAKLTRLKAQVVKEIKKESKKNPEIAKYLKNIL